MKPTGKVRDGVLTFDSDTAWLKALAPFEEKAVELDVREAGGNFRHRPVRDWREFGRYCKWMLALFALHLVVVALALAFSVLACGL